jgi:hypothetical protein
MKAPCHIRPRTGRNSDVRSRLLPAVFVGLTLTIGWIGLLDYGFLALIGHKPARLFAEATAGRTSLVACAVQHFHEIILYYSYFGRTSTFYLIVVF